jgi:hypothetical protein
LFGSFGVEKKQAMAPLVCDVALIAASPRLISVVEQNSTRGSENCWVQVAETRAILAPNLMTHLNGVPRVNLVDDFLYLGCWRLMIKILDFFGVSTCHYGIVGSARGGPRPNPAICAM